MPVVEDLDVLEDFAASVRPRLERVVSDELLLERREEALGDGVVPAVALAAHALAHAVAPEASPKDFRELACRPGRATFLLRDLAARRDRAFVP